MFPVSSTPGNLPVTVFHSGHLPHLPILSDQSDHSQKTLTAGKLFRQIFQRHLFPTPTTPRGAPGGDLQLFPKHRSQKTVHAPATRAFTADDWISRAGAWGRVRPFPATPLLLQPRLTPTNIPTSRGLLYIRRSRLFSASPAPALPSPNDLPIAIRKGTRSDTMLRERKKKP